MEELLNNLIKKGWKPFGNHKGKYGYDNLEINNTKKKMYMSFFTGTSGRYVESHGLREICSKESGLRQFCCENKMVKEDDGHITRIINLYKSDESIVDGGWDYHYWLMICSILDESELEQFLLDNINVECNLILNEKQEKI